MVEDIQEICSKQRNIFQPLLAKLAQKEDKNHCFILKHFPTCFDPSFIVI